ncbi:MAG: glutamine-hydrolyzing carbamoyl-phosphate synthase small subunit [Actinomycetota bacterium]
MREGILATADGSVFRGRSIGSDGIATGEVVFNTSMTGYQEIATDPSYAGQVVTMTAPHIGNYGVNPVDEQADRPHVRGFVTRSMSRADSSWRSEGSFVDYLAGHGIVVLTDVDTRRLTRHLRERGSMPVAIGTDIDAAELVDAAASTPDMAGRDLVSDVTTGHIYRAEPAGATVGRVVAYDFGIKRDIVRSMTDRGLVVTVVPASTPASDALALAPDGVFLSNGPGDPEPVTASIAAVRGLIGEVPIFGICLGHQILGLALGARTYKLPFGHHGGNHPVQRMEDGVVEITAQNHGFAVDLWSLTDRTAPAIDGLAGPELLPGEVTSEFGAVIATHQNLNDGTLEGLACVDAGAFSVQYHPEAAPGPNDATALFDRFLDVVGGGHAS